MTEVDPAVLVAALVAEGWKVVGHRSGDGGYRRLKRDPDDRHEYSILIPNVAGYDAAEPGKPGTVYVEIDDSDIGEIAGIWIDDATAERMIAAIQNAIEDASRARS